MGWSLLQLSIVFGVVLSDIHYDWTPNIYLPTLIGIALAWIATKTLSGLFILVAWLTGHRPSIWSASASERLGEPDFPNRLEPGRKELRDYKARPEGW